MAITVVSLKPTDFLGHWQLERKIVDVFSKTDARFSGTAQIFDEGARWIYRETGKLTMKDAKPMTAERRYIWQADAEGVDIHFEDGRFFHRLKCAGDAEAAHWCDPDQYDVVYDFAYWPEWQNTWHVRGPKKNYAMTSAYMPLL